MLTEKDRGANRENQHKSHANVIITKKGYVISLVDYKGHIYYKTLPVNQTINSDVIKTFAESLGITLCFSNLLCTIN